MKDWLDLLFAIYIRQLGLSVLLHPVSIIPKSKTKQNKTELRPEKISLYFSLLD